MSEIDRIAEKHIERYLSGDHSFEVVLREALRECESIVREECANKVEDQECDQTEYRCHTIERAAASIRNANKGAP